MPKELLLEEVRGSFKEGGCRLLATEYKNASKKMPYICSCGNTSEISLNDFNQGRRCSECRFERGASKLRHSYEYVKEYFEKEGCTLLSNSYKNNKTRLEYICECGNVGYILFNNFKNGSRCRECRDKKLSELLRGEKSPRWNPDIPMEDRYEYRTYPEYFEWREKVFIRDDYTCQKCFVRGGDINAHHINAYALYPELRTDVGNGATLCESCHRGYHRIYSWKETNSETFSIFMYEEISLEIEVSE